MMGNEAVTGTQELWQFYAFLESSALVYQEIHDIIFGERPPASDPPSEIFRGIPVNPPVAYASLSGSKLSMTAIHNLINYQ